MTLLLLIDRPSAGQPEMVDEQTGMLDDDPHGQWHACGKGAVTVYKRGWARGYHPGQPWAAREWAHGAPLRHVRALQDP